MKYDRAAFCASLKAAAPGLSSQKSIADWADRFHFSDGRMWASGVGICYVTKSVVKLEGSVLGQALVKLVDGSRAKEVDIELNGEELVVKLGRTRCTFTVGDPRRDYAFEETVELPKSAELLEALRIVSECAGSDPSSPARYGITADLGPEGFNLYSTNNLIITHCRLPFTMPERTVIQLPLLFCKSLGAGKLHLGKSTAMWRDGSVDVYCGLLEGADVTMYETLIKSLPSADDGAATPINTAFQHAVERATIFGGGSTVLSCKGDAIYLYTQSQKGEIADKVSAGPFTNEISVNVDPEMLLKAMKDMQRLSVSESCLSLSGGTTNRNVAVQVA